MWEKNLSAGTQDGCVSVRKPEICDLARRGYDARIARVTGRIQKSWHLRAGLVELLSHRNGLFLDSGKSWVLVEHGQAVPRCTWALVAAWLARLGLYHDNITYKHKLHVIIEKPPWASVLAVWPSWSWCVAAQSLPIHEIWALSCGQSQSCLLAGVRHDTLCSAIRGSLNIRFDDNFPLRRMRIGAPGFRW